MILKNISGNSFYLSIYNSNGIYLIPNQEFTIDTLSFMQANIQNLINTSILQVKTYDSTPGSPVFQGGGMEADKVSYDNSTSGLLAENVQDGIDELKTLIGGGGSTSLNYRDEVLNKIKALDDVVASVVLTTSGVDDLQTAITALTDGQTLEVKTNAAYNPISLPSGKKFNVKVTKGYSPSITGTECIKIMNGASGIIISGLTITNAQTTASNYKGAAITFGEHQTKVSDIIFHNIKITEVQSGSAVMLSYHWSVGGDDYANPSLLTELSDKIAFVGCSLYKACKDGTEGAGISIRGVTKSYIANNFIDGGSLTARGIQFQNSINLYIEKNQIFNMTGNGEAIKIDRLGACLFFNTGIVSENFVKSAIEGIDLDDYVEAVAYKNIISYCTSGIILDNDSKASIIANICYKNTNGIRCETGSVCELHNNVSYDNTTNDYLMENGYSLPESNKNTSYNVQSNFPVLQQYDVTVYVHSNLGISTAEQDGSLLKPFSTIQRAIDKFGQPTSAAEYQKKILIQILDSATYTENLTVPHRAINIKGSGVIISGNITREISDEKEYGIGSSTFRGCLTLQGDILDIDNHNNKRKGITVTGNYRCKVITGETGFTTHDTVFINCRIEGTVQADDGVINGGAPSVGNEVTYCYGATFKNTIEGAFYLQRSINAFFDTATISIGTIVYMQDCFFPNAATTLTCGDYMYGSEFYNFINTFFTNVTWNTSVAGKSITLDGVSLKSWIDHVTLGTNPPTIVYLENAKCIGYVPTTGADWADPDPTTIQSALDRIASSVAILLGTPIP